MQTPFLCATDFSSLGKGALDSGDTWLPEGSFAAVGPEQRKGGREGGKEKL